MLILLSELYLLVLVWVCGLSLAGIVGSNPPGARIYLSSECLFSGRGLCVGLIARMEESYRVWCV